MSPLGGWRRFFRLSESTRHREGEVDDELRFHIEGLVERHMAEGMSEEEARRMVTARFRSFRGTRAALIRDLEREARKDRRRLFFDGLRQDLRVSWRQCAKRPGFAAMAVVTLGLGIGASTTLFSVVNGVLLDPLPYPHSGRLVHVGPNHRGGRSNTKITAPEFLALKRDTHILEKYAAERVSSVSVFLGDHPERLTVVGASEDYADVFGASPILGRAFSEEDFRPGAPSVAILSHGVWQRYWGGDPEVLGTVIRTTGPSMPDLPAASAPTIIGVMPPSMDDRSDLWVPLRLAGSEWWGHEWQFENYMLFSVGRIRSGSSLADARAEMADIATRLYAGYPQVSSEVFEGRSLGAEPLLDRVVGGYRSGVLILFSGALLLLGIALANFTGLFLARALERRRELAIRSALGGGRRRILRQLMTETMSLSLLSGGLGFALASAGLVVLRALAPAGLPRLDNLKPDLRVVLFALVITLTSGLICALGSLPSGKGGSLDASLRDTARTGAGRATARIRSLLVSVQVSLAVILLVGAGLLSTSLAKLRKVDPGFEAEGLLVMTIPFPTSSDTPEARRAFALDLVRRIDATPGVVSASWTQDPPLYWRNWQAAVRTEETLDLEREQVPHPGTHPVGPDFFSTMGIPILRGRGITGEDYATNAPVAVVDEVAARELWPVQDPIGEQLNTNGQKWYTVVGVAGRVHQESLSDPVEPEVYLPLSRYTYHDLRTAIVIRSGLSAEQIAGALRAAVWEIDRTLPIPSISRAEDQVASDLRSPRFFAVLSSSFSLSALVLTLAAIFGLMSYWVTARTREVGLRMALGARAGQVLWVVQRQSMLWVLFGLAAGLAISAGASRVLRAFLFGISPLDPPVFAAVAVGLGLTAILAAMIPALRATRVDPTVALRSE